ncbi:hypothetical protein V8C86DRAFT_3140349 [Haematococcus lacustris]
MTLRGSSTAGPPLPGSAICTAPRSRTVRNSTLNVTVMPAPGNDDGWARVGASGKHRAIKQSATGPHAGLKQPAGVGSETAQPCISRAHVRQSQPTPGLETGSQQVLSGSKTEWETARNGEDYGKQPGRCASSQAADCLFSPRPGRSRRRVAVERTEEQVVEQLYQQVQDCRRQVQGSGFYSRLQSALLQLAPLLPPPPPAAAQQPPSPPPPHHSSSSPAQPLACGQPSADQVAARQLGGSEVETVEAANGSGGAVQSSAGRQAELKAAAAAAADLPTALPACQGPEARVQQLVVYGLGSPQASLTSRYQLALACLLQDSLLPGLTSPPLAFDPAFSSADQQLLSQRLGWSVLQHNEQCARVAAVPTFFYLPHVEPPLPTTLPTTTLPTTTLPTTTLPSTTLPSTTLPTTTLPSTTLPSTTLPSTTLPTTTLPSTTLPSTTLPSTTLPTTTLPSTTLPSTTLPTTTLPTTTLPSTTLPSTTLPSTSLPTTTLPSTTLPSTTLPTTTLPSTTLPSTTLPTTTLPSTTLPSTTLPTTTLPSTTLPSTTLPSTTLPSTTLPSTTLLTTTLPSTCHLAAHYPAGALV